MRVATGSDDEAGQLVVVDGRLVAVLVQLSQDHEQLAGHWFLEAAFGVLDGPEHPTFADLEAAQAWIAERLTEAGGPVSARP